MTSTDKNGISFDRIPNSLRSKADNLQCCICHRIPWKPVACTSCETLFCTTCIQSWLSTNPKECPCTCEKYTTRTCPPLAAKMLAQLQIVCFYESNGCKEIISYDELDKHEIECDFQFKQCPGCKLNMLKRVYDDHHENCPLVELTCENCKLVYKRVDAAVRHTEKFCLTEGFSREIQKLTVQLNSMQSKFNSWIIEKTITFDDLPNTLDTHAQIPSVYHGLKWTDMSIRNESYIKNKYPKSGYASCFLDDGSPNIAFFVDDAQINVESPNEEFTLISVSACAAWNDDLEFTIIGYRDSKEIDTHTTILFYGKPKCILLHWVDMDKIIFKACGGTLNLDAEADASQSNVIITQLRIGMRTSTFKN